MRYNVTRASGLDRAVKMAVPLPTLAFVSGRDAYTRGRLNTTPKKEDKVIPSVHV